MENRVENDEEKQAQNTRANIAFSPIYNMEPEKKYDLHSTDNVDQNFSKIFTSDHLNRQRTFLMIGFTSDITEYLDVFNRFLKVRASRQQFVIRNCMLRYKTQSPYFVGFCKLSFSMILMCVENVNTICNVDNKLDYVFDSHSYHRILMIIMSSMISPKDVNYGLTSVVVL